MKKKIRLATRELLELLKGIKPPGLPLKIVQSKLEKRLSSESEDEDKLVENTIEYALNNWLIHKIPAEPSPESGLPLTRRAWFVYRLSEDEADEYRNLLDVEKALLRLLQSCDSEKRLGHIGEDAAIQKLREQGFDVDNVPWIKGETSVSYNRKGAKPRKWYYLTPWYERTEEYQKGIEESSKLAWKKELLIMKEDNKNHLKKDNTKKD